MSSVALLIASLAMAAPPDPPLPKSMIRAAARRDPAPSCAELEALAGDLAIEHLREMVETVPTPPWAPVRAAACLMLHPEGVQDARAWVIDPNRKGLALLVLDRLHLLNEEHRPDVVSAALLGPWVELTVDRLHQSPSPAVRALVPVSSP